MPQTTPATETKMATQQKIAVGFIVATATMVLISAIFASIVTLVANGSKTTTQLNPSADRSFETK